MRLKQRPEDFSVTESWRFDDDPAGPWRVYLMDKQKLTTFEAVDRLCARFKIPRADVTYCGLKDKQGRTTQLVAIRGRDVELQDADLRLKPMGRSRAPLSAANTTSNRFAVTVRDLSEDDVARLPASVAEVQRLGVVNYFDSQRFGPLKHGQGFIVKELMRGDFETALKNVIAHPSELDLTHDAKVKQFWKEHWGEWTRRNPYPGAERYEAVLKWLKKHPADFRGALLRTEPRWRALQVFTYQSWLWNEGVRQLLRDVVGIQHLVAVRYQAGSLLFPRELDGAQARRLGGATFPLLGPTSTFADPETRKAALSVLAREKMTLASLAVPGTPEIHFDHEERPLVVHPGRLTVGEARPDELNEGRLKVNVAFTLPPGAYATLVVKRLFFWTLEPGARKKEAAARAAPKPRKTEREMHQERRETGFLAKKRAAKAAKAAARAAAKGTARPKA
ncbi:MAG TPA: tRNA pseudouridine(13) synthase TruD [Anaeromyxobacteraceae bacterium]|nr:tRNA pseudouridine(13) synthase TruD [Anaeromyxobacteraceae bacterium]